MKRRKSANTLKSNNGIYLFSDKYVQFCRASIQVLVLFLFYHAGNNKTCLKLCLCFAKAHYLHYF